MMLGGIFSKYGYRKAKGIIEALLSTLNISVNFEVEEKKGFKPSRRLLIKSGSLKIGEFGILETEDYIYYQFVVEKLRKVYKPISAYTPIPKYPAQIEDLTFILPPKTKVGEIIGTIKTTDKDIKKVQLHDIFKDAYTFRIWYRHPRKTLEDKEVEKIRKKIIGKLQTKHGANFKD
jgi:phenylalanyl-tRNA synthetase beta subunit